MTTGLITDSEVNRNVVLLTDTSKITRQKALQTLCNDINLFTLDNNCEDVNVKEDYFSKRYLSILESIIKLLNDQAEKNRDLVLTFSTTYLKKCMNKNDTLPILIPALTQRLANNSTFELIESSEEIRLKSIELLLKLCQSCTNDKLVLYLNEYIQILKKTIVDPYPEVRKLSCETASNLAKKCQDKFHLMSEILIKPLIETMKHQHAKVRCEAIKALGDVVRFGNNKSIEESVSPLAQRFFDHTSAVRLSVLNVIGLWLLELRDRYSYFHMLLPLILTGYTDDVEEIKETTDSLWWDIGMKYEKENEEDLKDQINFGKTNDKYPPNLTRPNLGCRELVKRHLIRILPAIKNDLTDWVVSTRLKSAQLLSVLTWQAEESITQHFADTIQVVSKTLVDDEVNVREQINQALIHVGYFVPFKTSYHLIRPHLEQQSQTLSLIRIINPLLIGVDSEELLQQCNCSHCNNHPIIEQLLHYILKPEFTDNFQIPMQTELLRLCQLLIEKCAHHLQPYSYKIFKCILSILSVVENEQLREQCRQTLGYLSKCGFEDNLSLMYETLASPLFKDLKESCHEWLRSTRERFIFETFIIEAGSSTIHFLTPIIDILEIVLNPDRDSELRNQSLLIIVHLLNTIDNQTTTNGDELNNHIVPLIKSCILPNMKWKAGRTAGAIRATAIATLWALFQTRSFNFESCSSLFNELLTDILGMLDDDDRLTRINSCKMLHALFSNENAVNSIDNDRLHKCYPDLLHRLDDVSDEIRLTMCTTLIAYCKSFKNDFNPQLYNSHLEDIAKTLLIHLDDQNSDIQNAIYTVICEFALFNPNVFVQEINNVKQKHRKQELCDNLVEQIQRTRERTE